MAHDLIKEQRACMHWASCPTPALCRPIMEGPCGMKHAPSSNEVTIQEQNEARAAFERIYAGRHPHTDGDWRWIQGYQWALVAGRLPVETRQPVTNLVSQLRARADWLRSEYLGGGDRAHLSAREEECRWLAKVIQEGKPIRYGEPPIQPVETDGELQHYKDMVVQLTRRLEKVKAEAAKLSDIANATGEHQALDARGFPVETTVPSSKIDRVSNLLREWGGNCNVQHMYVVLNDIKKVLGAEGTTERHPFSSATGTDRAIDRWADGKPAETDGWKCVTCGHENPRGALRCQNAGCTAMTKPFKTPERHSPDCDCHDCHHAKKHPQVKPHHSLCGCFECIGSSEKATEPSRPHWCGDPACSDK